MFRRALLACAALAGPVAAQVAAPPTPPIEAPRDVAFPGVITLKVDATDLVHGIFTVHETVPLPEDGPVTLLYPKWIPGHHSPTGTIDKLAGLTITANGAKLRWRRDPVEVTAFHVDPPAGATSLDLDFQYLSAVSTKEGHVDMTPVMLDLDWNSVVLYPSGHYARNITIAPSIVLPSGFTAATALEPAGAPGAYKAVDLNTLVDSPLMAGRYFRTYDLDTSGKSPIWLDVMADRPAELDAKPAEITAHRDLVVQADRLFGARHFAHYDFLLWLSDKLGGAGLEHHQSSEDGTSPTYFEHWDTQPAGRDLLAHEYTHSWNGKFRRPADLWTPNYEVPMRGSLLWVYEGQTQYWGYVLAARSGLLSRKDTLDAIALTAATYDQRVGRTWRPLEDTTNDPVIAERRPLSWLSWQRSEDYYSEGQMIWLDADTLIRERSGGRRSLDDFARRFFGIDDGSTTTVTYTFDDIVAALNAVQPYDWATFLRSRLESNGPGAPLDGLARGGYRLVFNDVESDYQKSVETRRKAVDLSYGIGLTVGRDDGIVTGVDWDMAAFKAGLTADSQIVAVNGDAYDGDRLKDAIRAATPITLLVKTNSQYRTVTVDYRGGLRYPHLERIAGAAPRLDDILTPRGAPAA
jgi:predicted metalloprotease with PDZ domain